MTDTGQVPGEGLPEDAGTAEPPGVPAPGAYTYLDPADATAEDDEILLMPGSQGAWGQQATDHSQGQGQQYAQPQAQSQPRRPLHMGPAVPDTNGSPVRSLADRGPAQQNPMPTRQSGPPTTGPEYLDIPPQGAAPWQPAQAQQQATPAETVAPQYAQPETPAHAQEFAQVGAESMPVGAYAGQAPYAAHEQGQGGYDYPQQQDYAPHGYAQQPAADQTLGQFVPVDGIVPTTPHLAPTPPQAMVVPPLPEEQEGVAAEQGVAEQYAGVGEQVVAQQQADVDEQYAAYAASGQQGIADQQAAAAHEVGADQQGAGAQAVAAGQQDATGRQAAAGQQGAVGPQDAAGQQPGEPGPQAGAEHEAMADQQGAGAQETGTGQQSAAAQHAAEQGAAEPHAAAEHAGGAAQQDVAAQYAAAEQGAVGQQAVVGRQAGTGPEGVAGSQGTAEQQPGVGEQGDAGQQDAIGQHGVTGEQPAPGTPGAVDQQDAAGQWDVVDHQTATGQHAVGDPQGAADQQAPADQESLAEEAPGAHDVVTDSQDLHGQAESQPAEPATAGQQAVGDQSAVGDEQVSAAQQAVGGHAVVIDPQAAADQAAAGRAAGDQSAIADQQVSADHHAVADQQAVPGQQSIAQPQATATPQAVIDPQDPHAMANQQSAEQAPTGDEAAAPALIAEPVVAHTGTAQGPESAEIPPEGAASVPAPREGDSGAIPLPESAHPEDPAEQTVAPAELTGEPEHLAPEPEAAEPHPAAPAYDDAEREAVLRVMRERRDIRNGFRSDPIPHEVLLRVLEAAHTAPSVGHSQPWDFVVIRSADTRRAMHELAMRQKDAYAKSLPKGRAKQFKELKIEAILDTPVNIVVTADPTRGGRHTLGRHTQPQMAPYSSALAVENLWLAARAEGLGVGWVSFFDEREMVRSLGLPEHLEVVAYLCVGYVDEFPEEPELMQAGWSKRRPLSWVVHEETYGRRALPGEDPHDLLAETVSNIRPLDAKALGEAWERQKRMTKPPGALGMLEIISAQLSGLSRVCPPPIPEPAAVAIFAGDHGVHAQGVTPWPQEVTGQMVANFLGGGAVCNAFASQVGAEVCVIDVGVAGELPATPGLLPRKVRAGTADMTTGPALTREEVKEAIEVGIETARDLVAAGNKALLTGEMGIANTTASAALISVYTEVDPSEVTGRGTGINDETHARKVEVVRRALDLHKPDPADPLGVLAAVGGLEHAAMVGLLLGGASLRTPVILDGVSAGAAALVARAIAPEVLAACIAGHRSAEPGHVAALNKLGLRPLVDLDLRLGEGTGALLALPIVQSAARAMHEVATFDSAGVTEK
ncbi:nicotinate-nucleotide--dimethylbenzimidazole phosphoribosyltransferase [Streptomyces sp. NBC_00006]|uniref:nicotinate-nucleotide--dimethylbenzimidazole phosphoribosyltransferase n=1 Tax=unclassified Streptomyces TaxID=2593676 RepID=UPI00225BB92E|nr:MULTISPECIES: nicotinate-nucleotide--dimethylbenzimidazole phosphoribosyltransferase [unclassified Streptomyces]MCX5534717.1 nicotinate-nucleotide--dimethylbenzimidazole phosphoribosyltransferase [Streptomyces sp. NBC_00006]